MPKIQADLSTVQSGFSNLPTDDYRCRVEEVAFDEKAPNPFHTITLAVDDPERAQYNGQKLWDRIYMNKKDGSPNSIALGRLKQYAEAILTEEEANSDDVDTDDFVNGYVIASVEVEPWEKDGRTGESNKIKRISPDKK
jgi:hypothetical protein